MADQTLAERLRELKLRDAAEADETAIERALQAKKEMVEERQGGDAELKVDDEDAELRAQSLAERLAEVSRGEEDGPRSLVSWFVGAEKQDPGQGEVTQIPPLDTRRWKEVEFYPVEPPYTFSRVVRDRLTGELQYQVIEPHLDRRGRQILEFVEDALVRGLNIDPHELDGAERGTYLDEAVDKVLQDYRIRVDGVTQQRIEYYIRRNFLGYGRIHVVMTDPNIEDISCDGAAENLFIFHRSYESIPTTLRFQSESELDGFVLRLAQRGGKAISLSDPILDAAMEDGSRLQATLGREVTQNGSTFTIRRFRPEPFTPLDLVEFGTMDEDILGWFWLMVESGASMIMAGGTASGKTTTLNALGQFIPPSAKVVTIEDTREVNLPHKNWIKSVTRSGSSVEGTGEIGMFELLKASLRQRPEYILVGEVRGVEATVAFQGMSTGHCVFSTMHADSARSVVYRLENEPINIPRLVLQTLDIIAIQMQVRIGGKRVRRISEIVELVGIDPQTRELLTNTVYRWDPKEDRFRFGGRSFLVERAAAERNTSLQGIKDELKRRRKVIDWMIKERIPSVKGLTDIVKAYYLDANAVLDRIEGGE